MSIDVEKRRRETKINQVLNYQVPGESYISSSSTVWKRIVLRYFKQVQKGEVSIEQLLSILKSMGVVFAQKEALVFYPVREILLYIAKVSNIEIQLGEKYNDKK